MSDLLAPFVVAVAAFVIVGALVGMLVAGPLDRLTSRQAADDPEHQEHQP